jgi:hypothetical protein
MTASLLEQAKTGDAEAIATLINRSLQSQGLQVRAMRDAYRLTLWVEAVGAGELPSPQRVIPYLRQGIERLQIPTLGILKIIGPVQGDRPGWSEEFSLLTAYGQVDETPHPVPPPPASPRIPQSTQAADPTAPVTAAVASAYRLLELPVGAPLSEVNAAYFRLKSLMLRQGNRDPISALKAAHSRLKQHLEWSDRQAHQTDPDSESSEAMPATELLTVLFRQQGLAARVRLQQGHLEIQLPADGRSRPHQVVAQIYTLLTQAGQAIVRDVELEKVTVYGLSAQQKAVWKRTFSASQLAVAANDTDLLSFNNRYSNLLIFPALMGLAMVMNAMPITASLLFGIKIWFHEFGHATVAWLAGRKAIPLPIGWTSVNPERSLLVYIGLAILLGLLYWSGKREQRRWPMILAVTLALLQFGMTWLMPLDTFEVLLNFGGIGGEFYLCTLLMVSFYFPLPAYWRWDFYRYPVVLGAAFTFWGQLWLWQQIKRGQATIPWGSLWGGAAHGDMNMLITHGWSPQRIIGTYHTLGTLCLVTLLAVYIYTALKHYYPARFIRQQ